MYFNTCYGPLDLSCTVYFKGFEAAVGIVRHGCERTVFGSDLDGVRPFRIRRQRPHVFVCAGSVAYIPATVQLPVFTCVLCILCLLTVSKLQLAPCGTVANARFLARS